MQVSVRMDAKAIAEIDAWRKDLEDLPSRPEAMRRLIKLSFLRETMLSAARKRGVDV